ncbi:Clc-like protein [Oesophagostomum dentatum]|uniref:Clc-like protein n=1 Tax=Oesophagostomum dentatum TaxID=61180 RepID=A0A0B1TJT4_OESDE|nr:Clc-like protein [Oesophagostomum dentatum]
MVRADFILQAVALLCVIVGLITVFVALSTPSWQVAYVRELQQWLQSGLWMSCQTRPTGMHVCSYAFSSDDLSLRISDDIANIRTPTFYTLICIGCSIAFVILSYMVEYRFYHVSVSGIYEKHRGYSFHLAVAGSILYLLALVLSVPHTLTAIRRDTLPRGSTETASKYHTRSGNYPVFNTSQYSQEEQFAMRGLPLIPEKYR